ncbi:hypothetical protein KFE25_002315 [Diacronema lutheri]|uniref:MgtC/SapB/SrpB/YhiD N-terminal domain-containing protein n=1 Tax=Diacronema lutheri TaxID=2081491 RepID=A0A7R9YPR3_DIALT|nr:hypothetical protein KFE25_002315 [Diacronema lutheri]|mmetsp:Transcript_8179/g.25866  ORF Transcript_8179/g.25866 Transcript_8179/m.25866 type:complete len:284 (+) Transcript_8179:22-873(+)
MPTRSASVSAFFSADATTMEKAFYWTAAAVSIGCSAVSLFAPLVTPVCDVPASAGLPHARADVEYPNPDYLKDPCKFTRYAVLLGMNKWECAMCARIFCSIVLGSIIGWERRRADRPAGIRTMAMVCMGSCVFTVDSTFAFWDGPMGWDASRVSAAIPSGVGFLGAASIWKGTVNKDGNSAPEVHGLTTATSVWLSAAVGILVGGGLLVPAVFSTFASVVYLRFAPRITARTMMRSEAEPDGSSGGDELRAPLHEPPPSAAAGGQPPHPDKRFPLERKMSLHV